MWKSLTSHSRIHLNLTQPWWSEEERKKERERKIDRQKDGQTDRDREAERGSIGSE